MNHLDEIQGLVAAAETARAALRALYVHAKSRNPKVSLAYLCDRAGIASKGYLSDVLRGRRQLNPRYALALAAAFGLRGPAARAFKLMVELDGDTLSAAARSKAVARLDLLRRGLRTVREPAPAELARMAAAFEVYCAFGLFRNQPTRAELVGYFGARHEESIDEALALLRRHKLVDVADDRYLATKTGLIFGASSGLEHLDFLRSSMRDAERNLKHWFPRRDEAYIESVVISVKQSEYAALLPLLRERVQEERGKLDAADADMLVRFNIQVYPVRHEGRSQERP